MCEQHLRWNRRGVLAAGATGLGLSLLPTLAAASPRAAGAAIVIRNGNVYAGPGVRGGQRALALDADGRLLALGGNQEIGRLVGPGTVEIDAAGGTIMSGIVDGHMHPLGAAEQSLNPSLGNESFTVPDLQSVLQGFLDASVDQEPDGWLTVTDWSPVGLLPTGTVAERGILDALDTERPMLLQGSDFHNALVNSRALALAGIDDSTPDPAGGEIVRDGEGRATGLLIDSAQDLVRSVIPSPSEEQLQAAYRAMAGTLLGNGITGFLDAASGGDGLATYAALRSAGALPQRVSPAILLDDALIDHPAEAVALLRSLRDEYAGHGIVVDTAKVFMDGVIEYPAQTAALLEPYLDEDGRPTDNRGDLYVSARRLGRLAVALEAAGFRIHAHALGDRAVRAALNAFEHAASRRGRRPAPGHTLAHLQLVHPDDYPRFARLGVIASMQLQWAVRDVWTVEALKPFIGTERFRRMYPARSLADAGAFLAGGSDWPVDPLSSMDQIATAIDRTGTTGRPALNPDQGLTRSASLAMHTRGGARQLFGGRSGLLEVGRRADVIVLDTDLTTGPTDAAAIRAATVQQTVIKGAVAFSR